MKKTVLLLNSMKNQASILITSMIILGMCLIIESSCSKKNDNGTDNENPVPITGTVLDIDSNVYKTIKIGNQVWMAENLRTTKLNDGTQIPLVTDGQQWITTGSPQYCFYNNDPSNKTSYGALYNWYSVRSGKLAPKGWHVATYAEWETLYTFLGPDCGSKMKETGTAYWAGDHGATNSSGFSARGGGFRSWGYFEQITDYGYWFTSTVGLDSTYGPRAICMYLRWDVSYPGFSVAPETDGMSVRCIKD